MDDLKGEGPTEVDGCKKGSDPRLERGTKTVGVERLCKTNRIQSVQTKTVYVRVLGLIMRNRVSRRYT